MTHHDVDCFTKNFTAIDDGRKKSDIRYDDRGYQIGDTITHNDGAYENGRFVRTGASVTSRISYIDDFGCQPGYLNLSLSNVGMLIVKDEGPIPKYKPEE